MPSRRKPRIRARLAGPSGLAAALAIGVAGPASASVHRAAVSGPGPGWVPAAAASTTDSPVGALAVLGACGVAGFLLLILGRHKDADEPMVEPPPPDLEAMVRSVRSAGRATRYPGAVAGDGEDGSAPIWVKRLNDQAPPPPEPTGVMDGAYRR